MKIGSAFPSDYLKAADLQDRPANVTIKGVKIEEVGRDKDQKPVLYFQGKTKGMVLNKTNSRTIAKIVGSEETDDWSGVEVVIYPTETEFAGEMVDCIRIRANKAQPGKAPATSPLRKPTPPPIDPEGDPEADNFHADESDVPF